MLRKLLNDNSDESRPSTPLASASLGGSSPKPQSPDSNSRSVEGGVSAPTTTSSNVTSTTKITATGSSAANLTGAQPAQLFLAGSNPMLASMLAQTPKTLPVAPITIPTSIVSQVPQERLPKNLEKKLIHTPSSQAQHNSDSTQPPW